jgi:hypothetical protein
MGCRSAAPPPPQGRARPGRCWSRGGSTAPPGGPWRSGRRRGRAPRARGRGAAERCGAVVRSTDTCAGARPRTASATRRWRSAGSRRASRPQVHRHRGTTRARGDGLVEPRGRLLREVNARPQHPLHPLDAPRELVAQGPVEPRALLREALQQGSPCGLFGRCPKRRHRPRDLVRRDGHPPARTLRRRRACRRHAARFELSRRAQALGLVGAVDHGHLAAACDQQREA